MWSGRTDLADEAQEFFTERAKNAAPLQGVRVKKWQRGPCRLTQVDVLDQEGSRALGKPVGRYITADLPPEGTAPLFCETVECLATLLRPMLPQNSGAAVLVAGLGNRAVTPDALGPKTVEQLLITRHLKDACPAVFASLTPVCAIAPGVLGTTGVESAEWIRGIVQHVQPCCVIVVDALAARRMERLFRTVQLSDTGLVPGSGIGRHRMALDRHTLGIPVLSVGVPTVIEAATLAADLTSQGRAEEEPLPPAMASHIVTPKDIDAQITALSKVVAYSINRALHSALSIEDISAFLG